MMTLEVCCTGLDSALIAESNGADRIELCMFLGSGGLTPSYGLLKEVLKYTTIPVFVLIRPREGNFVYSDREKHVITEDVKMALDQGVSGLVLGALTPSGEPDLGFMCELKEITGNTPITFHRAFDECTTPATAAVNLNEIGVERILTSGQALRADEGRKVFKALMKLENCPVILAGGGITPLNVHSLLELGIREIHFSARKEVVGHIGRGIFNPVFDTVDASLVAEMRKTLDRFKNSSGALV